MVWRHLLFAGTVASACITLSAGAARAVIVLNVTPSTPTSLTGTAITGGTFIVDNTDLQPTGTGVIDSFLRIQATGQERGYNTSVGKVLDDKPPVGQFTRAIQLEDIPVVTIGGVDYRAFLLDANQVGNGPISLNQVELFQSAADLGTSFSLQEANSTHDAVISFTGLSPVFQMNNRQNTPGGLTTNTEIWIDSGHGSGSGDMFSCPQLRFRQYSDKLHNSVLAVRHSSRYLPIERWLRGMGRGPVARTCVCAGADDLGHMGPARRRGGDRVPPSLCAREMQ